MEEQKTQEDIEKFEKSTKRRCYSKATIKSYKFHIKKFCQKYPKYEQKTQENLKEYLSDLREGGYSPDSLNVARASFIYFFEKILKIGLNKNEIEIPKRKKHLPRPVDRWIIKQLIDSIKNYKHKLLIEFAYSSGLRPFEAIKIRWNDIDLNQKIVFVDSGKGNKDRYSIISKKSVDMLIEHKKAQEKYNPNSIYVFDSMQKPSYHLSKKTFQKILEKASIKEKIGFIVTPYNLRHSFGTHSIEEGINLRYVQSMMGHSSPKTTERYTLVSKFHLSQINNPSDNMEEGIKRELNQKNQEKFINFKDNGYYNGVKSNKVGLNT